MTGVARAVLIAASAVAGCATGGATTEPEPGVEAARLLINPRLEPYRLRPPRGLVKGARAMAADLKICVAADGSVESVKVVRGAHPQIDPLIPDTVRRWKYAPARAGGKAVPHCHPMKYTFTVLP
jgi:outer membrane biosynthesis protein TonB